METKDLAIERQRVQEPSHDVINHPSWYCDGGIETLDFILAKKLDFLTGQVVKYLSRAGKKDPGKMLEDLKKAQFYLNRKIAEMEAAEGSAWNTDRKNAQEDGHEN